MKNECCTTHLFVNKENCCGCTACYAICPVKAISMDPDEEGFLYPSVDTTICIHCHKCITVCVFKMDQIAKGFFVKSEEKNDASL